MRVLCRFQSDQRPNSSGNLAKLTASRRASSLVSRLATVCAMPPRCFSPPWTVDEMNDVCFIVRDKNGQQLGYFYYELEPGRRRLSIAGELIDDLARCIPDHDDRSGLPGPAVF